MKQDLPSTSQPRPITILAVVLVVDTSAEEGIGLVEPHTVPPERRGAVIPAGTLPALILVPRRRVSVGHLAPRFRDLGL